MAEIMQLQDYRNARSLQHSDQFNTEAIKADPFAYHGYDEAFKRVHLKIKRGRPIPENTSLSVVAGPRLTADHFRLRPIDRSPYAGKSAHIAFTDEVTYAVPAIMGIDALSRHHLYTFPSFMLRALDFLAIFDPHYKNNRVLHATIMPYTMERNENGETDIPLFMRELLAEFINDYRVRKTADLYIAERRIVH